MPNPLVGTPIVIGKRESDLLLRLFDNDRTYCCTEIDLVNNTGAAVAYKLGKVIVDANAMLSDAATPEDLQPAFTDALLLRNVTVPAHSTRTVPVLVRGPALVNFDEVEDASDDESESAKIARLADLVAQGVRFVREPASSSSVDLDG